jgi:uncharacterized protein (TIGR02246 family)
MSKVEYEEIQTEVEKFVEAWTRGDAKAAASFHAEDGVRVGAAGDMQHGRAAIEAAYVELFGGRFAGAKVTQQRGTVRVLAPGIAIWQGAIEIDLAGKPPLRGYAVQVMKRIGHRWLVLESHPKLFPT